MSPKASATQANENSVAVDTTVNTSKEDEDPQKRYAKELRDLSRKLLGKFTEEETQRIAKIMTQEF